MNRTKEEKRRVRFVEAAQNVLWALGAYENDRVMIDFYAKESENGLELTCKGEPDDHPVLYVMNNGDVIVRNHEEYEKVYDHVVDLEEGLEIIDSFKGPYSFLSNFHKQPITYKGVEWATSEHAYQAMKTLDEEEREEVRRQSTPGRAKRAGRKVTLRNDWEEIKVDVMHDILKAKFSVPEMRDTLLLTEKSLLVEGNHWGDTFWGVCKGEGENWLGRLLMKIRRSLWNE